MRSLLTSKSGIGLFVALSVPVLVSCSVSGVPYSVLAANYGVSGVILQEIRVDGGKLDGFTDGLKLRTGIPGINDDLVVIEEGNDRRRHLPRELEIHWQLSELKDCKQMRRIRSNGTRNNVKALGYDPDHHIAKLGCVWAPNNGKMYRQKLDLSEIKQSGAYERAGKTIDGNLLNGVYTLNVLLVFEDARVSVEGYNGKTMGFMQ